MAQRHFWDQTEAASSRIIVVDEFSADAQQAGREAAVWHAWEHIPLPYFPDHAPVGTDHYAIQHEADRGPQARTPQHMPHVIVVRVRHAPPVAQPAPGQRPQRPQERDVLWIECKAPSDTAPHRWHTVLREATDRLDSAHGNREVFLILAIGMEWMCFWNPVAPLPANQKLRMRMANNAGFWDDVDNRIHPIPAGTLPGQRQIVNNVIETTLAYTLNYWDVNPTTNLPAHLADLTLLENLFAIIQNHQYNEWNPDHF